METVQSSVPECDPNERERARSPRGRGRAAVLLAVAPAVALGLALTGCSGPGSGREGAEGASRTPSPSSSGDGTATGSAGMGMGEACNMVGFAVSGQQTSELLTVADTKKSRAEVRTGVAKSYATFEGELLNLVLMVPGDLAVPLADWASASHTEAQYIATEKPRAGIVFSYGPAHRKWEKAKKSAEKVCGHPLPDTR